MSDDAARLHTDTTGQGVHSAPGSTDTSANHMLGSRTAAVASQATAGTTGTATAGTNGPSAPAPTTAPAVAAAPVDLGLLHDLLSADASAGNAQELLAALQKRALALLSGAGLPAPAASAAPSQGTGMTPAPTAGAVASAQPGLTPVTTQDVRSSPASQPGKSDLLLRGLRTARARKARRRRLSELGRAAPAQAAGQWPTFVSNRSGC